MTLVMMIMKKNDINYSYNYNKDNNNNRKAQFSFDDNNDCDDDVSNDDDTIQQWTSSCCRELQCWGSYVDPRNSSQQQVNNHLHQNHILVFSLNDEKKLID